MKHLLRSKQNPDLYFGGFKKPARGNYSTSWKMVGKADAVALPAAQIRAMQQIASMAGSNPLYVTYAALMSSTSPV